MIHPLHGKMMLLPLDRMLLPLSTMLLALNTMMLLEFLERMSLVLGVGAVVP